MKTIEQVKECCIGRAYETKEFIRMVNKGLFNGFDGIGFMHDGEDETDISVFDFMSRGGDIDKYPYVCWYNK